MSLQHDNPRLESLAERGSSLKSSSNLPWNLGKMHICPRRTNVFEVYETRDLKHFYKIHSETREYVEPRKILVGRRGEDIIGVKDYKSTLTLAA